MAAISKFLIHRKIMKNFFSFTFYAILIGSFALPIFYFIAFTKKEAMIIITSSCCIFAWCFSAFWYFRISPTAPDKEKAILILRQRINYLPKMLSPMAPNNKELSDVRGLREIYSSISNKCFSGIVFGVAIMGFSGQYMIWLGEESALLSGVYGSPLKYPFMKSLFSACSAYFFLFGLSAFIFGSVAKFYSWRFK